MPHCPLHHVPPEVCLDILQPMDFQQLSNWHAIRLAERDHVNDTVLHRIRDVFHVISEDTDDFCAMMCDTGIILSSSAAARLLLVNDLWQLNDYDLYMPHSQWDLVLDYISNLPGFTIKSVIDASDEDNEDHLYPWLNQGMDRMAQITGLNIRVDVMHSHNKSAFYLLCFFWSTIIMNAIFADAILSANPTHLISCRGICSPTITGNALAARRKYED